MVNDVESLRERTALSEQTRRATVASVELQGDGSLAVFHLEPQDESPFPVWTPGAHIDVMLANGLTRQYSLSGSTHPDAPWRIAVLREANSRGGSEFMHTNVAPGDSILLRGPRNNFPLVAEARRILFVAGGIGITPLLPMMAQSRASGVPFSLIYGGRSRHSLGFLNEVGAYGDDVTIWPQDERGLIPISDVVAMLEPGTLVYGCGPEPLLKALEDATAGLSVDTLHVERFRPRPHKNASTSAFKVYLEYSDVSVEVSEDASIVEALEKAGMNVVTSCREGTCGTCETVVLDGVPDHRDSYLSATEQASNETMMICCSRSKTPRLVLDL